MNVFKLSVFFFVGAFGAYAQKVADLTLQKDFAPGYPTYTVSAIEQLKHFPDPRFGDTVTLHRNFSWFDFMYMSYDYSKTSINKNQQFYYPGWLTKQHAQDAIEMNLEMMKNWNYYFNIPSPTYNASYFSKPNSFSGAIAKYANEHPEIPICTYLFWGGVRHPGGKLPYIKSFEAIDPCVDTMFPLIAADGQRQREQLKKLLAVLPDRKTERKIDFVNENGEVFGPVWTPNGEGYRGNKSISCIQPDSITARQRRGHWQYQVFRTYKNQFINHDSIPGLKNSEFSFYQIAGFLPVYYGDYNELRNINQKYKGSHYSTPDFYPGDNRHNIFDRYAANHGLDCIAEGRFSEIEIGDIYFSPFICAGWFEDSLNYRPAPWLASLKALALMGAEFYYPSYFNITNPSKKVPNDPKGYIYQVAMPSYAQAVTERFSDIFFNSTTFNYEKENNFLTIYREDTLKAGRFVIFTSWFKKGTGNDSRDTLRTHEAEIGGKTYKINYPRQGAVYILDRSANERLIFYQLDSWHEATHPYYWSRDISFEAEVNDNEEKQDIRTEVSSSKPNDLTDFTTYVNLAKNRPLRFVFQPRAKDTLNYFIWVKARSGNKEKTGSLKAVLNGNEFGSMKKITSFAFEWYCISEKNTRKPVHCNPEEKNILLILAPDDSIQIDKIVLTSSERKPE